jgi:IS30 family transposase
LKIEQMKKQGKKQCEIAYALHISEATISRELKRGVYEGMTSELIKVIRYSPDIAQARYDSNKTAKGAPLKIGNDYALAAYIEKKIAEDKYSPCAALAEIRIKRLVFSVTICRQTLYSYIDKGVFLRITNKDLPFKGKRRKHKTRRVRPARASVGESIEKRPEGINDRVAFGHWEMDTVVSSKTGRGGLLVLTERVTRQEIAKRVPDLKAQTVVQAVDKLEKKYGKRFPLIFRSITIDNGTEFSDCPGIERSIYGGQRTKCYYCHPYSAYERGSNEKQNQMIRRYFPKGTNFNKVTDKEVSRVVDWLNNYPRQILGWNTSEALFQVNLKFLALTY